MNTKERTKTATKKKTVKKTVGKRRAAPVRRPKPVNTDVVYTAPEPFCRRRFLLRLITVVAVVLALILGMSIFFKVEKVTVSGAKKYTAWDIKEASGIQIGENLLTISDAKIGGRIKTKLPYVDMIRVGIKLPDTVHIEITELDVVYAIAEENGGWWLMTADGRIAEQITPATANSYTKVLGVQIQSPQVGQQAVAKEPELQETVAEGETIPAVIPAGEQLSAAISILQYLEDNGIIGEAASINVTSLTEIELWYGDRYQIYLGDTTQLSYKITTAVAAVEQMGPYQSGKLDVSFTTWPNEVGYTPFQ